MTREESIKRLTFFEDKPGLAEQILRLEKQEQVFLPNQFEIKQTSGYEIGEKIVLLGRLENFYFIGIKTTDASLYQCQAFVGEASTKAFFVNLPDIEKELMAFWLNEVELVR